MKTLIEKTSNKLVRAFLKNKIIAPIPLKFSKKLSEAQKLRKLCESKIKEPVIGFKAAGTGIPLIKKFKEKEPFYASVYKRNLLKSGNKVKKSELSKIVAEKLAKKAQEKKITKIFFDRGIYKYHGRVKVFAETLRKNGMEF